VVSWWDQKLDTAKAWVMPVRVRWASAHVVVSLPSRAAQWHCWSISQQVGFKGMGRFNGVGGFRTSHAFVP
jgi:hypothetical protein